MGLMEYLGFGGDKNSISAIIVYPTKKVILHKIRDAGSGRFSVGKGTSSFTYLVDEEAIYNFKNKPLLFYRAGSSSPVKFSNDGLENTLSSQDFTSVMNSKVVTELLTASDKDFDLNFLLQMASIAGIVLLILNEFGVLNLG